MVDQPHNRPNKIKWGTVNTGTDLARRNRRTAITAFAVVGGMVGLAFAFVPLYTLICQVTGLGGTPQVAERADTVISTEDITIRFDANVDRSLPWTFKPNETAVTFKMGDTRVVSYQATNQAAVISLRPSLTSSREARSSNAYPLSSKTSSMKVSVMLADKTCETTKLAIMQIMLR